MPDWIIDGDALRARAIFEEYLYRIADIAFAGIEIVFRKTLILTDFHFVAQRVDSWIRSNVIFVIGRGQATEYHRHGNHVLNAVVPVRGVIQRAGLVDDANARFLGFDDNFFYVVESIFDLIVQRHAGLDRGLSVELRRKRDFEQDILHYVAAKTLREGERLAFEQHVEVAPGLRRQCRRISHFARQRDQRESHGAACRITGCPALA